MCNIYLSFLIFIVHRLFILFIKHPFLSTFSPFYPFLSNFYYPIISPPSHPFLSITLPLLRSYPVLSLFSPSYSFLSIFFILSFPLPLFPSYPSHSLFSHPILPTPSFPIPSYPSYSLFFHLTKGWLNL